MSNYPPGPGCEHCNGTGIDPLPEAMGVPCLDCGRLQHARIRIVLAFEEKTEHGRVAHVLAAVHDVVAHLIQQQKEWESPADGHSYCRSCQFSSPERWPTSPCPNCGGTDWVSREPRKD